jgi:hypothetical protein
MIKSYVRGSQFDSRFSTDHVSESRNADLYLITRVFLQRYDPPGGTEIFRDSVNTGVRLDCWTSGGEWLDFRMQFKRQTEGRFRDKLWLVPSCNWGAEVSAANALYRPNVKCMLRVDLAESEVNAHLRIICYHIPRGGFFRSSMDRRTRRGSLDNQDQFSHPTICEAEQETIPHEFGHYVGLSHVGRRAPGCVEGNEDICYCPSNYSGTDLMGGGDRIDPWHAGPWIKRIGRHLVDPPEPVKWSATIARPRPLRLEPPRQGPAMGTPFHGMNVPRR